MWNEGVLKTQEVLRIHEEIDAVAAVTSPWRNEKLQLQRGVEN